MAEKAAAATGADLGDGLRKRPVPSSQALPTPQINLPEDDKKKLAKKVYYNSRESW